MNAIPLNTIPSPDGLSYFPFQLEGIRFALSRSGTLLADEMGLGKTRQAIGVINASPDARKVLIVCPASVRIWWKRQLEEWLVRPYRIGIVENASFDFASHDVVIINYDRLHQYKGQLHTPLWDLAILDECHFAKTPESRRTQMALAIQAARKLALSGTPLQNRPAELRTILSWLDPSRWPRKGWHDFALRYCGAFWDGFSWNISGARNLDELGRILRETVMIRRSKAEVLPELPPKLRTVVELSADGELGRLVEAEFEVAARELSVDFSKVERAQNLARLRHEVALAKVPLVIDFVREALTGGSQKVVVYAHHRDVVAQLVKGLAKYHPVSLVGDTPLRERQKAIDTFQSSPSCRVFIGNIQAAGTGITLTASSHCVFAELSWVPSELSQAEDRLHRIGAKDSVLVHHLVLEGSLDALMIKVLLRKQRILDSLFMPADTKDGGSQREALTDSAFQAGRDVPGRRPASPDWCARQCSGAALNSFREP